MMAFVWCPKCKKHLIPEGVVCCSSCSTWLVPDPQRDRDDFSKGDVLLAISVVAAALLALFLTVVFTL
jgi:hypothetical protein